MLKFEINNTEWIIKEITEAEINNETKNDCTLGVTIYKTQEILLLKEQPNLIRTLKHELIHVWLYEYGHNQQGTEFDYEDVCEIVASCNDFINEIVEQYLGIKKLYVCEAENNKECSKKSCYINDGVCMYTTNVKYAKRFNNEC